MHDVRDRRLTDYGPAALLWAGVLMFVCRLRSRRRIRSALDGGRAAAFLRALCGQEDLERFPHGDTLRNFLLPAPPEQLRGVCTGMVRWLIEGRRLEFARLLERYYTVALDGTQWLSMGCRQSRFTRGCLTRTLADGAVTYYRNVLEAKLVSASGLALSVETEFCENQPRGGLSESAGKQDCEHSAAKRLLPRLKEAFARLPVCLLLDGLYADGPIMRLCRDLDWRFMIVMKEGSLPSVWGEFHALIPHAPDNRLAAGGAKTQTTIRWVNDIAFQDLEINVLECVETHKRTRQTTRWLWVTDIPITRDNAADLALHGGRQRWRIENEGYNAQKNDGYEMEHAYALDPVAAKNFYLLLQIAHILSQMFECAAGGKKKVAQLFGSLQEMAARLLESIRNQNLPAGHAWRDFINTPIQVRLKPPDTS